MSVEKILEEVYISLQNDNKDIDPVIDRLKTALKESGEKEVTIDAARLAQNNRQGRKLMQSYFRKRGVSIVFGEA